MKTSVRMDYFHLEVSNMDLRNTKKEHSTSSQSSVLVAVIWVMIFSVQF